DSQSKSASIDASSLYVKGIDPFDISVNGRTTAFMLNAEFDQDNVSEFAKISPRLISRAADVTLNDSRIQLDGIVNDVYDEEFLFATANLNDSASFISKDIEINSSSLRNLTTTEGFVIKDTIDEIVDEIGRSFSVNRDSISIKSTCKTISSTLGSLDQQTNFIVVNFINVEGDVNDNEITIYSLKK
ncbi:MAG: hypothetical protein WD607_00750, partial [Candidatus Paceibacterota bacterium]